MCKHENKGSSTPIHLGLGRPDRPLSPLLPPDVREDTGAPHPGEEWPSGRLDRAHRRLRSRAEPSLGRPEAPSAPSVPCGLSSWPHEGRRGVFQAPGQKQDASTHSHVPRRHVLEGAARQPAAGVSAFRCVPGARPVPVLGSAVMLDDLTHAAAAGPDGPCVRHGETVTPAGRPTAARDLAGRRAPAPVRPSAGRGRHENPGVAVTGGGGGSRVPHLAPYRSPLMSTSTAAANGGTAGVKGRFGRRLSTQGA